MPVDIPTMLVATDLSEASAPATASAFSLARALLSVVPEDDVRMITVIRGYLQSEVTPAALVDTFSTEADKRLTALVEDVHATDLVHKRLMVTGQAAAAIMHWAAAQQVQRIIIGTHGRHGVTRFLMGSVAECVLREAPCAVLVVPAPTSSAGPSPSGHTSLVDAPEAPGTQLASLACQGIGRADEEHTHGAGRPIAS
jgi:nucleotide-binding universal stress UspA family protein